MNPGYHTLPVAGAYGGLRAAAAQTGGLAPAKVSQPWGLSSLRPAPPVRPSAALIYKEVSFVFDKFQLFFLRSLVKMYMAVIRASGYPCLFF